VEESFELVSIETIRMVFVVELHHFLHRVRLVPQRNMFFFFFFFFVMMVIVVLIVVVFIFIVVILLR